MTENQPNSLRVRLRFITVLGTAKPFVLGTKKTPYFRDKKTTMNHLKLAPFGGEPHDIDIINIEADLVEHICDN